MNIFKKKLPQVPHLRESLAHVPSDIIEIGKHSLGKPRVIFWDKSTKLVIGNYTSIAEDSNIFMGGNHNMSWLTTYPFTHFNKEWPEAKTIGGNPTTKGDIIIGNDVWICRGATILSGVTIGDGAVIGAYAVVSRDVEPYSIVVGNPAQHVKFRFAVEDIAFLLKLKWWEWSEEKIRAHVHLLCSGNIAELKLLNSHLC